MDASTQPTACPVLNTCAQLYITQAVVYGLGMALPSDLWKEKTMYHIDPLQPRREQSTQYMGEVLAGRRSAVLPRHALGRRINIYVNLSICVDLWSRLNN